MQIKLHNYTLSVNNKYEILSQVFNFDFKLTPLQIGRIKQILVYCRLSYLTIKIIIINIFSFLQNINSPNC